MPEGSTDRGLHDRDKTGVALPFRTFEPLRFRDQDCQGHVNNAVYSTLFECNRVSFQTRTGAFAHDGSERLVLAALAIEFRRELRWPATIEIGLGCLRIGRSSFDLVQEISTDRVLVARARLTQVVLDAISHRPKPLTEGQRQVLTDYRVAP